MDDRKRVYRLSSQRVHDGEEGYFNVHPSCGKLICIEFSSAYGSHIRIQATIGAVRERIVRVPWPRQLCALPSPNICCLLVPMKKGRDGPIRFEDPRRPQSNVSHVEDWRSILDGVVTNYSWEVVSDGDGW